MGLFGNSINRNVVLSEEAFEKASSELDKIAERLRNFHDDIESNLNSLQNGFDTPAGDKYQVACKCNVLEPIIQQINEVKDVAEALKTAKNRYQSVFNDYEKLNQMINNVRG